MSSPLFLTPAELQDMTDLVRPTAICRWLDRNGYEYQVSAAGWPKVLRDQVYQRQDCKPAEEPVTGPDWDNLKRVQAS